MDSVMPGKWWFHSEVQGVHLLFENFVLDSTIKLFLGYVFVAAICWSERAITYYLEHMPQRRGWKHIAIRTGLYAVATVFRLWYMLITMYFNTGLFIVIVASLSSGQLALEYMKAQKHHYRRGGEDDDEYAAMIDKGSYNDRHRGAFTQNERRQRFSAHAHEEEVRLHPVDSHDAFELSEHDTRNINTSPR